MARRRRPVVDEVVLRRVSSRDRICKDCLQILSLTVEHECPRPGGREVDGQQG